MKAPYCECCDAGCPVHRGNVVCHASAVVVLYRVDMHDETGTAFCDECATDAYTSDLYTDSNAALAKDGAL